jgi:pimeloyl-ACP methyl ester carboxylesterase
LSGERDDSTQNGPRSRKWRVAKTLACGIAVALGFDLGARELVARAVALAPNALRLTEGQSAFELPQALARRGAVRIEAEVGPPAAKLVAWRIEPELQPLRGSVVLLHGVRMDRRSLVDAGLAFSAAGFRSILVDLRGHGESTGDYLTYGAVEAQDISTLLDQLIAQGTELGCVGAFGFSYGAAVALELGASDPRVQAVVAVAPFASLREVVADYRMKYLPAPFQLIPAAWFDAAVDEASRIASFDPDAAAPVRAVSRSRAHQLLIHGTADTQVPLRHSLALASVAGPLARLLRVDGASHDSMPPHVLQAEAAAWFGRWLATGQCASAAARRERSP